MHPSQQLFDGNQPVRSPRSDEMMNASHIQPDSLDAAGAGVPHEMKRAFYGSAHRGGGGRYRGGGGDRDRRHSSRERDMRWEPVHDGGVANQMQMGGEHPMFRQQQRGGGPEHGRRPHRGPQRHTPRRGGAHAHGRGPMMRGGAMAGGMPMRGVQMPPPGAYHPAAAGMRRHPMGAMPPTMPIPSPSGSTEPIPSNDVSGVRMMGTTAPMVPPPVIPYPAMNPMAAGMFQPAQMQQMPRQQMMPSMPPQMMPPQTAAAGMHPFFLQQLFAANAAAMSAQRPYVGIPPAGAMPNIGGMSLMTPTTTSTATVGAAESSQPKLSVWVGNLPFDASKEELVAYFLQCGDVDDVELATRKEGIGSMKNHAFVKFKEEASAKKAVDSLNFNVFKGREVHVSFAKPTQNWLNMTKGDYHAYLTRNGCKLFVSNLPLMVRAREVFECFVAYGNVLVVSVPRQPPRNGLMDDGLAYARGFASVLLDNPSAARQAIYALSGSQWQGRGEPIGVEPYKDFTAPRQTTQMQTMAPASMGGAGGSGMPMGGAGFSQFGYLPTYTPTTRKSLSTEPSEESGPKVVVRFANIPQCYADEDKFKALLTSSGVWATTLLQMSFVPQEKEEAEEDSEGAEEEKGAKDKKADGENEAKTEEPKEEVDEKAVDENKLKESSKAKSQLFTVEGRFKSEVSARVTCKILSGLSVSDGKGHCFAVRCKQLAEAPSKPPSVRSSLLTAASSSMPIPSQPAFPFGVLPSTQSPLIQSALIGATNVSPLFPALICKPPPGIPTVKPLTTAPVAAAMMRQSIVRQPVAATATAVAPTAVAQIQQPKVLKRPAFLPKYNAGK